MEDQGRKEKKAMWATHPAQVTTKTSALVFSLSLYLVRSFL